MQNLFRVSVLPTDLVSIVIKAHVNLTHNTLKLAFELEVPYGIV